MWICSTENKRWYEINSFSNQKGDIIEIGSPKGKPLYGFGTCLSELGLKAISLLPESEREKIFDDFFW